MKSGRPGGCGLVTDPRHRQGNHGMSIVSEAELCKRTGADGLQHHLGYFANGVCQMVA